MNCARCGFETCYKQSLVRHLTKRNPCDPIVSNVDRVQLLNDCKQKTYNVKTHDCEYCQKRFNHRSGKYQHQRRCTQRFALSAAESTVAESVAESSAEPSMADMLTAMRDQIIEKVHEAVAAPIYSGNNTIQQTNIQTQNNVVVIHKFGQEDMDHLTDAFKTTCLKRTNKGLVELIEKIHFDEQKPANANIRISNKKLNFIETHNGKKWVYAKKDHVLNDLMERGSSILTDHYEETQDELREDVSVSMYEHIRDWIVKLEDADKKSLAPLLEDIYLLILNG